jgi:hypothetical protein
MAALNTATLAPASVVYQKLFITDPTFQWVSDPDSTFKKLRIRTFVLKTYDILKVLKMAF